MSKLSFLIISIILSFAFSINYMDEIQPIFNTSCVSCHNSDSPNYSDHQLNLTSYAGLMLGGDSGSVIVPFDASSSLLWQKISQYLMPPYGSGIDFLSGEQTNLIADWINDGALEEEETSDDGGDDGAPECMLDCEGIATIDPDDDANAFCEWFIPTYDGTSCMDDCEYDYSLMVDQIYSMCELCLVDNSCDEMWNSEDCSDFDEYECEISEDCEWNDYDMICEDASGDDGAPECMLDCEGIDTIDPDDDANAFCEWFIPTYDGTSCMDDCEYDYGLMVDQIYSMCELCLVDNSCDEMWNSDDCSDLDQSDCEDNADCNWNDYDMMCEDSSDDGPPECWLDCEGSEVLYEGMTGTELCTWFVPVYEDGSCLGDCDSADELFMNSMIYSMCSECLQDDSCDDMFDEDNCSDLDQSECEENEDCEWNDYDMMCEDSSDDGPPPCLEDCPGIWDVDPEDDATAFCNWYIPTYDDGSCMGDCGDDYYSELNEIYSMCQICLVYGDCDGMWDDLEGCSDLDPSECEENGDCQWNDYDMSCEDASGDDGGGECAGLNEYDCESSEECDWNDYDMICEDLLEGECLDSDDCQDGLFCNMDHTSDEELTAGFCEPCDYYSAIEDCYTDGLPEAGAAECADVCFDDGGDLDNDLTIQDTYKISSIYPNPFNPTTTVTYQVPEFSTISIDIYNMNGQLVENLYRGYKSPGEYSIEWTAGNITSGAYLIKLVSGSFVETQKVMLVK